MLNTLTCFHIEEFLSMSISICWDYFVLFIFNNTSYENKCRTKLTEFESESKYWHYLDVMREPLVLDGYTHSKV